MPLLPGTFVPAPVPIGPPPPVQAVIGNPPQFFDIGVLRPPETTPPTIIPIVTDTRDVTATVRLEGTLYLDLDQNGFRGEREEGIPSVLVLLEPTEQEGELARTLTETGGRFVFGSVRAGRYRLRFILPAGLTLLDGGNTESIVVASEGVTYVDVGAVTP
jgi:hypothetical protein